MKAIIEDIDLVYLLGKGSNHEDLELLLSLRSVDKLLTNYRNIYIVGEDVSDIVKSSFKHQVFNVIIPSDDGKRTYDQKRKLSKLIESCKIEELSDDFLLMSDDYILCEKTDARAIKYHYTEKMIWNSKERVSNSNRLTNQDKQIICNDDTFRVLSSLKTAVKRNYETKQPFIVNKKRFLELIESVNWDVYRFGLMYKTLYANYLHNVIDPIQSPSFEVSDDTPETTFQHLMKSKPFLSITGSAFNRKSIDMLMKKFRKKSQWEI